ncbi:hypothetical protein [Nocardioides marmotae]|uniref:Uncharacterized protein n=1 Tax=Nocardioides marmotae TaxID=2663857 RepID=A0A6I3JES7_9ACTN|nr:hypothetical protein [Nocardioides marmotae]MCR6033064.1 hypothetical protein [Gordonia jinghuaiqii]MBC9732563.1 hypothetical protein [Nocardioides marmotae]MTB83682.1 hypothetical protein [Nocardioides marmotae]MTB96716.1 hypothetical protein [Nocardioides marmotae]QKE03073.1 hypothetical protein HPC71_19920 [Nocardioides marmotae]
MIDTTVDGSESSVRSAATYLGDTLKTQVVDAGDDAQSARSRALSSWDGDASTSFRAFARQLVEAADEQEEHLREARQKFDAYAGRLGRIKDRMRERRQEARGAGLVVNGMVIETPADAVGPGPLGADATPRQADAHAEATAAYEAQKAKIETYNRLLGEVQDDHEAHTDWIRDNLSTFWSTVHGPSLATTAADVLAGMPAALTGLGIDLHERSLRENAAAAREESKRLRQEAEEARDARRSGNPARRAAGEGVDIADNRGTARALDALAEGTERIARRLPLIGGLVTVAVAGGEIAGGESPSSVIVGEAGGIVGGVLGGAAVVGGAALLGVGAPVIAVAAGAAVVGVGAGMAAQYAYENWVPDEVRDKIDDGLRDFGNGVADVAGDVGDALTFWD